MDTTNGRQFNLDAKDTCNNNLELETAQPRAAEMRFTDMNEEQPVTTGRKQDGTFAPGVSGNPNGRPKSSRHKLSERFIDALLKDFEKASEEDSSLGELAIQAMRTEKPNEYAKMIAGILAKEIDAKVDGDVSPELKRWLGLS